MATGGTRPDHEDWGAAFDGAPDPNYIADLDGKIVAVNRAAIDLHRLSRPEIEGQTLIDLGLIDAASWQSACGAITAGESPHLATTVRELGRAGGEPRWVEFRVVPIRRGALTRVLGVARDVTASRRHQEQLEHLAFHDALTGLSNLAGFRARLRELIIHGLRNSSESWAILMIDLDHFKAVNDTLGHSGGDRVLRSAAERIQAAIRTSDHAYRVGGDEFAVIARHLTHIEDAAQVAHNVIRALSSETLLAEAPVQLGGSIGIVSYPQDGDTAGQLLRRADSALYAAKSLRGGFRFWNTTMERAATDRLLLRRGVACALKRGELQMAFQPIVRSDDPAGGPAAVEGLLRWNPVVGPPISTREFLELAEEIRVIRPMGEWALEQACSMAACLRSALGRSLPVGVNLTASELERPDLVELVQDSLSDAALPADSLQVEFTAGGAEGSGESGLEHLQRLADLGVSLTLDNVGVGRFPFGILRNLPVRTLKIDGDLVTRIADSELDSRIVHSLIDLARGLGARSLADSVETGEQLRRVQELGCELVQGRVSCPPLAGPELIRRLAS
jgi:diguanylate cyclase (GGDEF)-like protein/PAS domain S-box-containing protein